MILGGEEKNNKHAESGSDKKGFKKRPHGKFFNKKNKKQKYYLK